MVTRMATTGVTNGITSIGTTIMNTPATTQTIITPTTIDIATGIGTAGAANDIVMTLNVAVAAIIPVMVFLPSCLRRGVIFSQGAILANPSVGIAPRQYRPGRVCGHFRLHGKTRAADDFEAVSLVHPSFSFGILVLLRSASPKSRRRRQNEVVSTHAPDKTTFVTVVIVKGGTNEGGEPTGAQVGGESTSTTRRRPHVPIMAVLVLTLTPHTVAVDLMAVTAGNAMVMSMDLSGAVGAVANQDDPSSGPGRVGHSVSH